MAKELGTGTSEWVDCFSSPKVMGMLWHVFVPNVRVTGKNFKHPLLFPD